MDSEKDVRRRAESPPLPRESTYTEPIFLEKLNILVSDDDQTMISMQRLNIPVLPSVVNAALITAGNAYTFNASRRLHALALDGRAPKFLRRLNKRGVPYMAVIVVMLLSCLAYLALGSSSVKALNWIPKQYSSDVFLSVLMFADTSCLHSFCIAATMFNWTVISFTWIRFNAALKAQGIDKKSFLISALNSNPTPATGHSSGRCPSSEAPKVPCLYQRQLGGIDFIFNYGIIALASVIGIGWKILKRTMFHKSEDVDLVFGLEFIDALTEYYQHEQQAAPVTVKDKSWPESSSSWLSASATKRAQPHVRLERGLPDWDFQPFQRKRQRESQSSLFHHRNPTAYARLDSTLDLEI
ncbi:hypothetical protein BDW60DRAFT_207467 [Aspergillus nidulans var. acristatus]